MNRGLMTAACILIASHTLVSLISRHGGEMIMPSFYPAPYDTLLMPITEPPITTEKSLDESPTVTEKEVSEPVVIKAPQPIPEEPAMEKSAELSVAIEESEPESTRNSIVDEPDAAPTSVVTGSELSPMETPDVPSVVILDETTTESEQEPALSPEDSLLILIPERTWPDSNRVRGELTPEIATEYPTGQYVPRRVDNTVWGVGERLVFSIDYGFLNAGTATMSVLGTEEVNGAECYHIQTTARSNDFISTFYEVRDQVNSYIDKEGIFSRRIEKLLREGSYKSDRYVDFYPDRTIAISNEKKKPVTEIPLYVQDVLSSLYLIRTYDLEIGSDVFIETYADGKVYPLRVKVHKTEKIKVPAGTFTCWVVEPFLQSDGIFRQKGQLKVWLTKDEHKMPVKMTSKIVIGSIGTNLESYTLGTVE